MAAQSLAAKLGMRSGTLGSSSSLAIAAPIAEGDLSMTAHTAANRIGQYYDRTPGAEKIGLVVTGTEILAVGVASVTSSVQVRAPASTTSAAPINVGQGVAPTAPVNGDIWITSAGMFAQVGGSTVGPFSAGGGTIGGSIAANQVAFGSGSNTIQGSANLTFNGSSLTQTSSFTDPVSTTRPFALTTSVSLTGNNAQITAPRVITQSTNNAFNYTANPALMGLQVDGIHAGTGTMNGLIGIQGQASMTAAGTLANAFSVRANGVQVSAAGTIATARAFYAGAPQISGGGAITTYNALEIEPIVGATTNRAIYTQGAGLVVISDTTTASSSTVGAVTVGNGTSATSVALGGGNIFAGGRLTVVSGPYNVYGIETSTGMAASLTSTNTSGTYTATGLRIANTSATGTHNVRCGSFSTYGTISTGQTNSGSWNGNYIESIRNYVVAGDTGTLASLIGESVVVGHFNSDSSTPTTTTIKGVFVNQYRSTGTIGTMYGIYLGNGSTTVTPTAGYGIYLEDTIGTTAYALYTNAGAVRLGDVTTIAPPVVTSGTQTALTLTGAANTGLTASTEVNDINLNLNRTVQWATGNISTQRSVFVQAPTYAFVGASTISDAATFAISGAPAAGTNATITRAYALWSQGGTVRLQSTFGDLTVGQTGAPFLYSVSTISGLTASTQQRIVRYNLNTTMTWPTGNITTQSAYEITPPTYAFAGASTITNASTFTITGAPTAGTNATFTNAYAQLIQAGKLGTAASSTSVAGIQLPHGTAPTSPVNGDMWTTTAGLYVQINGSTVGPLSAGGGGTIGGSIAAGQVAVGSGANTIAGDNTLQWTSANGLTANRAGTRDEFFGFGAGNTTATTSADCTAVGYQAGTALAGATDCTLVGSKAGTAVVGGTQITAVGSGALSTISNNSNATAVGFNALKLNTAADNTALGALAAASVSSSARVTAIGKDALTAGTTGISDCTAVGYQAMNGATGVSNTAIGASAGTSLTTGTSNVFVGASANGVSNGANNVVIGASSSVGTALSQNTVVGASAGCTGVGTTNSVSIGYQASSTAASCVTIGQGATSSSQQSVAVGAGAKAQGNNITSVGYQALPNATGINNTALGSGAGSVTTTGTANIFLGFGAGDATANNASNRLVIGGNTAPISTVFIGNGESNAGTPQDVSICVTAGSGTNKPGANLFLCGGQNTGSGQGGSVFIKTAKPTVGTLDKRLEIDAWGGVSFYGSTTSSGPNVSAANNMTIFYDQTLQAPQVSVNTAAYTNLMAGAVAVNQVAYGNSGGSNSYSLAGSATFTFNPTNGLALAPTAVSSGTQTAFKVTGASNTGQTASTEVNDVNLALNRTVTWAAGAITNQRAVLVQAPTYAFASASTITTAATFAISGAPAAGSNATLTNTYALWVQAGTAMFGGSVLSNSSSAGIGYATGAGGTVTQGTSRTTGVTLNTICGQITLFSAAGSTSFQTFTVTNSSVGANDIVEVVQKSGTDLYEIFVTNISAGSFKVTFATTGGTTTEQPVFTFAVIKAVAA